MDLQRQAITATGQLVHLFRPKAALIRPDDLIIALANTCRFGGQCRPFYSVAQHSVHVWRLCRQPWALLHDAAEAYLGDVRRSMRDGLGWNGHDTEPFFTFDHVEYVHQREIAIRFNLHPGFLADMNAAVRLADDTALATEFRDLFPAPLTNADQLAKLPPAEPAKLVPLPPELAAATYERALRKTFPEAFK